MSMQLSSGKEGVGRGRVKRPLPAESASFKDLCQDSSLTSACSSLAARFSQGAEQSSPLAGLTSSPTISSSLGRKQCRKDPG
jgi:hypothetical protein